MLAYFAAAAGVKSFARGAVETRSSNGLTVPASAVMYGTDGAFVLLVAGTRVSVRKVEPGLQMSDTLEIRSGLVAGDVIVAKSGTFLRDGDLITPVRANQAASKGN